MEKLKPEYIAFLKTQYENSSAIVRDLVKHIEAIELELKVAKEDEVDTAKKFGELAKSNERLIESVGQLYKVKQELELTLQNSRAEVRRLKDVVQDKTEHALELQRELESVAESRDYYHKERDKCESEIKRLMNEVDEARAAWLELEKQVPKKVVLSQGVADAIEHYRGFRNREGVTILYNPEMISERAKTAGNDRDKVLSDYIFWKGYNEYFLALINGYTVEQTKEERLREGAHEIISKWFYSCSKGSTKEALKDVSEKVTDFVTKFNAEN